MHRSRSDFQGTLAELSGCDSQPFWLKPFWLKPTLSRLFFFLCAMAHKGNNQVTHGSVPIPVATKAEFLLHAMAGMPECRCSTALSRRSGRTSSRKGEHFLLSEGMHFFWGGFALLPELHGLCHRHGQVLSGRGGMSLASTRQATTPLRSSS